MSAHHNMLRPDLKLIADMIPVGSKVLDIGCGKGDLLAWLSREKLVDGRGIELRLANVNHCIAAGLPVVQGDADTDLSYYPDGAYDYAILSQTIQTMRDPKKVLLDLVRIAKFGVVSVPNFGHWKNRAYLAFKGRMPVTKTLSYQWHDTPNIHFCTISDFVVLCEECGIKIERRQYVDDMGKASYFQKRGMLANLLGQQGVFMLSKS